MIIVNKINTVYISIGVTL